MTNIFQTVQGMMTTAWDASVFLASVTDTSGNRVQFARPGVVTDGIYYQAADGLAAAVSPADLVLVIQLADGTIIVLAKIVG